MRRGRRCQEDHRRRAQGCPLGRRRSWGAWPWSPTPLELVADEDRDGVKAEDHYQQHDDACRGCLLKLDLGLRAHAVDLDGKGRDLAKEAVRVEPDRPDAE